MWGVRGRIARARLCYLHVGVDDILRFAALMHRRRVLWTICENAGGGVISVSGSSAQDLVCRVRIGTRRRRVLWTICEEKEV